MEPVKQPAKRPLSWAALNPFAKADRGELTPTPQPRVANDDNPDLNELDNPESNVDPRNKNKKKTSQEGDDPLLNFDSLWQPNKDKDGNDIVEDNSGPQTYLPKLDPKKFSELVGKMDFTKDFDKADLDALKAGGEEAIQATITMMNKVARRTLQSSLAAASKLAEQGFTNAQNRFRGEIPDHVRNLLTENELSGSVAIMANPAFAPMVNSVKAQYLKKFPKASPREVNGAVKQYFDYLGSELTKKTGSKDQPSTNSKKLQRGDPDADFLNWIEKDLQGNPSAMFRDSDEDNPDNSQNS